MATKARARVSVEFYGGEELALHDSGGIEKALVRCKGDIEGVSVRIRWRAPFAERGGGR